MPRRLPLPVQTMYAELVERCGLTRLVEDFPVTGSFFTKRQRGRDYWYFQEPTEGGHRRQRYVGPDTPELRARIEEHREAKDSYKERRTLVTSLERAGIHNPGGKIGRVVEALADAGVFRMRAVLVGTLAYQTYSGLLGYKLGNNPTEDIDIAQFKTISIAVQDQIDTPILTVLQNVDPRFRAVSDIRGNTTHYAVDDKFRVDLLTPNRGPDDEDAVDLPSIQSQAQPLRFLDFLIYQEVQAALLFGGGVLVNVPAPERYALHKLIVSRMRIRTKDSQTKAQKDLRQAGELIEVLGEQRPYELRDLWKEMVGRGPKWSRMAEEAVSMLDAVTGSAKPRKILKEIIAGQGLKL